MTRAAVLPAVILAALSAPLPPRPWLNPRPAPLARQWGAQGRGTPVLVMPGGWHG
jgi:hypothetical protein